MTRLSLCEIELLLQIACGQNVHLSFLRLTDLLGAG